MPEFAAWSLVVVSFLLLGGFGYASVTRNRLGMICGAVISALVLNWMASQFFSVAEIRTVRESGTIQEEQMQPDGPGLMAGTILSGGAFFLGGLFVGKLRRRARSKIFP